MLINSHTTHCFIQPAFEYCSPPVSGNRRFIETVGAVVLKQLIIEVSLRAVTNV